MKNIKYLICLAIFSLVVVGCSDDNYDNSAEASATTFLPKLTMNGSPSVQLSCDASTYTDAGVEASEGGNPVDVSTITAGRYYGSSAVNGVDIYDISYVAYNKDSIPGAAVRNVFWPPCTGDLVTSLEGVYMADVVRNGSVDPTYQNLGYILIKRVGDNVYQISDAIGGYYEHGRGYGHPYAGTGMTVTANDISANDFTHTDVIGVGLFGGELSMTAFSVDAANRKINLTTDWSFGFVFEVELTQVDL